MCYPTTVFGLGRLPGEFGHHTEENLKEVALAGHIGNLWRRGALLPEEEVKRHPELLCDSPSEPKAGLPPLCLYE